MTNNLRHTEGSRPKRVSLETEASNLCAQLRDSFDAATTDEEALDIFLKKFAGRFDLFKEIDDNGGRYAYWLAGNSIFQRLRKFRNHSVHGPRLFAAMREASS